jgi:hypothetical protein
MSTNRLVEKVVRATTRHTNAKGGQLGGGGGGRGRHGGAPRVPFALLVTGLIVGGMALLLLLNTASAANEVQRHDLAARDASIAAGVQELQNEVAASAAPGNLAEAAAALGMVPAGNPAFLVIAADGSVKVMGSAAPASVVPIVRPPHHKKKAKSSTAKTSAAKTTGAKSTGAHGAATGTTTSGAKTSTAGRPTAARKSTPTPTPTPTLTLPGGNR